MQCEGIAAKLMAKFRMILRDTLCRVKAYRAPRMRFHAQVPSNGGKQVDFTREARPIIQKQINEWLGMEVIKQVIKQPACVSPLLLIPNEKKAGFRLCHDLRMLSSATVTEWGPAMNWHLRMQSLPAGKIFSSFDLSKGFLQIPIPKEDQNYFGMFVEGNSYVLIRFSFGFINSMQFFNTALAHTMTVIAEELEKRGYASQERHWVIRYVDDALIGYNNLREHLLVLRVIMGVLAMHGWILNVKKRKWGVKELEFLGCHIFSEGIRPRNGLIQKFGDLKLPKN